MLGGLVLILNQTVIKPIALKPTGALYGFPWIPHLVLIASLNLLFLGDWRTELFKPLPNPQFSNIKASTCLISQNLA